MKRSKNFLFFAVLLSVVIVVLMAAAIHYTTRRPHPRTGAASTYPTEGFASPSAGTTANDSPTVGTPSAAAQKRAKEFNDAVTRFNAPDGQ